MKTPKKDWRDAAWQVEKTKTKNPIKIVFPSVLGCENCGSRWSEIKIENENWMAVCLKCGYTIREFRKIINGKIRVNGILPDDFSNPNDPSLKD